jgi:hypothetical protein
MLALWRFDLGQHSLRPGYVLTDWPFIGMIKFQTRVGFAERVGGRRRRHIHVSYRMLSSLFRRMDYILNI